ncbi:hypothetical protein NAL32_14355 [Chryseobacterium sp. Ch-15]|uniref:Uncharacterized protein n=1 Tax=Chryseobacterium muglaense TaxID=2893752 RepID=A0A9Q3YRN1_9FLAO|nr:MULTISPECIES: hypothetical protein [Chryseobacterium]MBD3905534.1 hypothetical protein [Chryseobacterium muglaense]MBO6183992.1 hypothetical protein [Chryseobacterium sp.]MCC9034989.1 hypothetical protein [Chryseobacterium muglaense]MCM2555562.1 hypothetical protein [Chryseobacterium muglaense]
MKNLLFGLLATSLIVASCKKDEKPTYLKDESGTQQNVAMNSPKPSLIDQAGIKTSNGSTMVTAPGMNPPHGQPGHKCEIPVGQPLNGAPAAQNPASQNIQVNGNNAIQIDPNSVNPTKTMPAQNSQPVKTAPGMNPPHGEPGHRCDISVGQPLNSKPTAQNNAPVQVQAPQPAPTPQPVVANTGPKPKNNPAHGEPWHDCAKQVGAAL